MHIYGKKLKEYREKNKLTQNDMAKILLMKQSNYSRLEKGEQDIKLSMILTICEKLNISADQLLGTEDNKKSAYNLAIQAVLAKDETPVKGTKIAGESLTKKTALKPQKATTED